MKCILDINNYIEYEINEYIEIKDIIYNNLPKLIDRFVVVNYLNPKRVIYKGAKDLTTYHFVKNGDSQILDLSKTKIKRFVKIGDNETGKLNKITDVPGVLVGHKTINDDKKDIHTGVTVIQPHKGNMFREKVVASSYSFNGFGKTIGLIQIDELGTIETNIALTSTLCVNRIAEGVIKESLDNNIEIGVTTGTVNPVVMECNDGAINNSRLRILNENDYFDALKDLKEDFLEGDVGAGAGMVCHGFKGGIGSSSRIIKIDDKEYTLGILCNSNFGSSNGRDLIFKGRRLRDLIKEKDKEEEDKGSIVCVLATDIPLNERQLKRCLKRVEIGIGRTGSYAGNGSGDVFIGFTTANKRDHFTEKAIDDIKYLSDDYINQIFKNVVDVTEEAIINSMLYSHHVKGFRKDTKSLQEYNEIFSDLFDEVVEYE